MRTQLFILLFIFSSSLFSQRNESQVGKDAIYQDNLSQNVDESTQQFIGQSTGFHIRKSGEFLQKSANFSYFALGSLAASAILSSIASNKDNQYNGSNNNNQGDFYYAISGLFLASSVVCTIISINYKIKAGKQLKLTMNGTTGCIVYTF
ncbi:hypothetical protein [Bacteroides sedimenti]|uniref:Transmembrane protein n=1 Tax=Bacteroides sedimenti TaxID=2136147 RepID=A0ABN6Z1E8_9BACE